MKKSHFWAVVTALFVFLVGSLSIICAERDHCSLHLAWYMTAWFVGLLALGASHFVRSRAL